MEDLTSKSIEVVINLPHPSNWVANLNCSNCGFLVTEKYLICEEAGHLTCLSCWESNPSLVCGFRTPPPGSITIMSGRAQRDSAKETDTSGRFSKKEEEKSSDGGTSVSESPSSTDKTEMTWEQEQPEAEGAVGGAMSPPQSRQRDWSDEGSCSSVDSQLAEPLSEIELVEWNLKHAPCGSVLIKRPNIFVDNLRKAFKVYCPYANRGCNAEVSLTDIHHHYTQKCPFSSNKLAQKQQHKEQAMEKPTLKAKLVFRFPTT